MTMYGLPVSAKMDIHGYPSRGGIVKAILSKWGNCRAVRIPSEVCAQLGVDAGSVADLSFDAEAGVVTLAFEKPERRYSRSRKMTLREFAAGWTGDKVGEEWGGADLGAEVVR